ncbi:MAG: protein kinase [Candidatus Krumholzibacteria bacterium]
MIGRTIGRYKIVAKIGEGGMGTVWKAEDPLLDRSVALKFLPESLSTSTDARKRLLREARSASDLHHSGIATVYDAGEEDDRVYIAMQFIDGKTVAARIGEGTVSISEATRIAREACEALGHAHSGGVLHRDVTARNIMTAEDGHVVIVDFGLALPEGASRLTRSGVAIGTTAYLAPEVLRGEKSDQRSDIYGLGVVLYEMLTGKLPFIAERHEAVSYMAVHEDAKPPSQHRVEIDTELDRMVLKALAKDPAERYQTSQEFEADLRAIRGESPRVDTDAPVTIRRSGVVERVSRLLRRPLPWAIMALIIVVAGAVVWKAGLIGLDGAQRLTKVAVLPLVNYDVSPSENNYLAEGISETLAARLSELSGLRVTPWSTSRRFSDASMDLRDIAKALRVDVIIVGTLRRLGDRIQGRVMLVDVKSDAQHVVEEFEEPYTDLFQVQKKIAIAAASSLKGRITGQEQTQLARPAAQSVEAYEHYLRGGLGLQEDTTEGDNRALAFFEKAVDIDPNLAEAYVGIGVVYQNRFFYGRGGGVKSLEVAETNFRKALERDPQSAAARRGLVRVFMEWGKSEECLKQGQAMLQADREDIDALSVRGEAYVLGGLPDKAVPLFQRIIELDPENQGAHWYLVFTHVWAGQNDEALEAGQTFISKFGEDPEVHTWIAVSYHNLGEWDAAAVHYDRAIALFGDESNMYVFIYAGILHKQMGDPERAREIFSAGVEISKKKLAAYPDNHRVRDIIAGLYGGLGDKELFLKHAQAFFAAGHRSYAFSYIASGYLAVGERDRWCELLRQCGRGGQNILWIFEGANAAEGLANLSEFPGWEECIDELRKLDKRLRAQY